MTVHVNFRKEGSLLIDLNARRNVFGSNMNFSNGL